MKPTSYKNHVFGTFTLHADELAWESGDGVEGSLGFTVVTSVWLGEVSTGSTPGMGNAALTGVMDGTVLRTIPGKQPATMIGGEGLWAIKIRSKDQLVSIFCNPATEDDDVAFTHFVRATHENIHKANPSVSYIGGGVLNFLVFIFLSLILLVFGGGTAFLAQATGLNFLFYLGGIFTIAALALLTFGIRTSKPKPYDPLNIPSNLFPEAQIKENHL